jgi:hypothetical protein
MRVWIGLTFGVAFGVASLGAQAPASAPPASGLPVPAFHHVHLNSADPTAAIREYLLAHPSNVREQSLGFEGFRTSNDVRFLFTRVNRPPQAAIPDRITRLSPQNSFWHFVFPVANLRETLARYHSQIPDFAKRILPLYTGPDGKTVEMSGDTLPGFLTPQQMADARAQGAKPTGDGGYISWIGPDGAIMEASQGPVEKLTIFGMFQEQPFCAIYWYQRHLNAPPPAAARGGRGTPLPAEANCIVPKSGVVSYPSTYKRGHVRVPPAVGVNFSDVFFRWYMNQEEAPLAPMRGTVVDHFALSVPDLDPWIAKFRAANLKFLEGPAPYMVGSSRAVMIEGPSLEAIEIIEVRSAAAGR